MSGFETEDCSLDFDVVVVGGGPAGLAAAGWLGRHRRKTLLVDSGEYRNRWVDDVHGFLGSDPSTPADLREQTRREVKRYPHVELRSGEVANARRTAGVFELEVDGQLVTSRRAILATGVRDEFPAVGRFFEFYGSDVFSCPTCDGFEARGQRVAVFGWGAQVAGFAAELLDWAAEVCIVTDGRTLDADDHVRAALSEHGIEVVEDEAVALVGRRGALEAVRVAGGDTVECTMAFFSIAHQPVTGLAQQLGCELDSEGYVRVDEEQQTTVAGVYAAGDLTPGMQLATVAAGAGTVAGVACATSLRGELGARGAPRPGPHPDQMT